MTARNCKRIGTANCGGLRSYCNVCKMNRRGECWKHSTAPNRRPTFQRGAIMADASQYTDSMPRFNPAQTVNAEGRA
jgi:hypothetical protein